MQYTTLLVNAHRPAMDAANVTGLPQTIFYHPDWGYSNAVWGAKILRDKQTTQYVTWLPIDFFPIP